MGIAFYRLLRTCGECSGLFDHETGEGDDIKSGESFGASFVIFRGNVLALAAPRVHHGPLTT
jgi:hypothetical protein